VIKT
jgi:WD40 repeat protein